MGNIFTKLGRLPRAALLLVAFVAITLAPLFANAPKAQAFDGDYALAVKLSNSRNDVTITTTREGSLPVSAGSSSTTVSFSGSGTSYKTPTILHTNSATCTQDHSQCTWSVSVKDKSGKVIGSLPATLVIGNDVTDAVAHTFSVTVPAQGASPSATGTVQGKAQFVDTKQNNTTKGVPSNVTIKLADGTHTYTTNTSCAPANVSSCNATYSIANMVPGTYTATMNGGYQNPNDTSDAIGISYTKGDIAVTGGKTTTADLVQPADPSSGTSTDCDKDSNGNCKNPDDATLDCGAGAGNWFICFGIQLLQGAAQQIDSFITAQLNVDTSQIFNSDNTQAYKTAWNSFRIIAIALLLIAGLVMVTSQALGFEFLDAYTIRKTLPRILIAVIGISLSWPLTQFVINLFNVIGYDVRQLIYAPFDSMAKQAGISTLVFFGNPLTIIGAGTALFIAYGPAVFTFLITGFLALIVAFLVLVIRQLAIIVLVILAPLAIACYVLPNTQKAWKLWMDNFMGLMLMFPIISALIAAGHVMSAVGRTGGTIDQFVALIAYFVPYFMLPFAFRLAAGAIGTIAGLVNDRSKGAFDRLKKYRGEKLAENTHKIKQGDRFSERNALSRGFNTVTGGLGSGWKGGYGFRERGKQARDQRERNAAQNEVMKSAGWATIQENDDALHAATYNSASQARAALTARFGLANQSKIGQKINDRTYTAADAAADAQKQADSAVAAAQASIGFGRPQAIAAAQQLAATGTGYTDLADQAMTIARASGGNTATAGAIAGFNNFINKQKGRHDLAPGAKNLIDLSTSTDAMSNTADGAARLRTAAAAQAENSWNSGSLYQLANGKKKATENFTGHWVDTYKTAMATGDSDSLVKATRAMREMRAMLPNASGDNQIVLNDAINRIQAMREDYIRSHHFVPEGRITAKTAEQVRLEQIESLAERGARVYERPDPAHLGAP